MFHLNVTLFLLYFLNLSAFLKAFKLNVNSICSFFKKLRYKPLSCENETPCIFDRISRYEPGIPLQKFFTLTNDYLFSEFVTIFTEYTMCNMQEWKVIINLLEKIKRKTKISDLVLIFYFSFFFFFYVSSYLKYYKSTITDYNF